MLCLLTYFTRGLCPAGIMVRALDLRLQRSCVRVLAVTLSGNNLGQIVHTHVPLLPSSMIWYRATGQAAVMPCGWEGNHRSHVAPALHHRLQWFIHLRARGLRKRDEHPPTLLVRYGTLYLYLCTCVVKGKLLEISAPESVEICSPWQALSMH